MRFVCENCRTRYSIPDEKARGRALKVRCKRCQNIIVLRPQPAEAEGGETAEITEPKAAGATPPPPPPPEEEDVQWYIITGGRQEGPISRTALVAKIVAGAASRRSHVWSEQMDDWKRVEDVPELAAQLPEAAPPLIAPRRPPAAAPKAAAPAPAPRVQGPKPGAATPAREERVSLWSPEVEPLFPAKKTDGRTDAPEDGEHDAARPAIPTPAGKPPRAADKGALQAEKEASKDEKPAVSEEVVSEPAQETTGPHEAAPAQPQAAEEAKPEAPKPAEKEAKPAEPAAGKEAKPAEPTVKDEPRPAAPAKIEEKPAAEPVAPAKPVERKEEKKAAPKPVKQKIEKPAEKKVEKKEEEKPPPVAQKPKAEEKPPKPDDEKTEIDTRPPQAIPVASRGGGEVSDPFKHVPDAPDLIEPTVGEMTRFVIAQSGLDEPRSPFRIAAFVGAGLLLVASLALLFSRLGVNIPIVGRRRGPEKYFSVHGASNAGLRNQLLGIRHDRPARPGAGVSGAHASRPEMGPLAHKEEQHVEKLEDSQRQALAKLYASSGPGDIKLPAASSASTPAIDRPDAPLTPQQVAETVSHYQAGYGRCIDMELKRNPNFQGGKIKIVTTIMGSGLVRQAEIQSDDPALARRIAGSSLGSCLIDQTRRMVFPNFAGDPFDAELPLVLGASM